LSKERFIRIKKELVPVSEEVYFAFKRPAWRERKRKKVRAAREISYERLTEDGFDIPSEQALVDEAAADRLLLNELYAALDKLTEDERSLINDLFFDDKTERKTASERSIHRNSVVYRRNRILGKLKNILKK
jgi:DNA-directed RNA polymerase specialized sigma subunit